MISNTPHIANLQHNIDYILIRLGYTLINLIVKQVIKIYLIKMEGGFLFYGYIAYFSFLEPVWTNGWVTRLGLPLSGFLPNIYTGSTDLWILLNSCWHLVVKCVKYIHSSVLIFKFKIKLSLCNRWWKILEF